MFKEEQRGFNYSESRSYGNESKCGTLFVLGRSYWLQIQVYTKYYLLNTSIWHNQTGREIIYINKHVAVIRLSNQSTLA